jgi:hypothetical protein
MREDGRKDIDGSHVDGGWCRKSLISGGVAPRCLLISFILYFIVQ